MQGKNIPYYDDVTKLVMGSEAEEISPATI